jgi:hypothetical protein
MSNCVISSQSITVAQLKEMFGPPPLLSSESIEAYDKFLAGLVDCFNPSDPFEAMLVRQVADETAFAARYTRHHTLAIDGRLRRLREFQAKQAKALAERKSGRASANAERAKSPQNEDERMMELVDVLENTLGEVDGILDRAKTERDHARALESAVGYIEQLDNLLNSAIARRNVALRQLEAYREGFGRHLRRVSDEVIGEFKELAPALSHEVTTLEAAPTDAQGAVPPAGSPEVTTKEAAPTDAQSAVPPVSSPEIVTKEAAPTDAQGAVPPAGSPEVTTKEGHRLTGRAWSRQPVTSR